MLASVVSNPVVASSESEMCSEELGSSEMEKQCAFVGLLYVSVCVGREEQPRMAAGSWQGWQSWAVRVAKIDDFPES